MTSSIAIIGAGPAGMTAAIYAARSGQKVTLIDGNAQVGRKLLVTGSGRANLTNRGVSAQKYACGTDAVDWLNTLFNEFGPKDLIEMLNGIGLLTQATPDGWYYPVSESAQTVVTAFANELKRLGVQLLLEHRVTAIHKSPNGFTLSFAGQPDLTCSTLLVAAGGKAYPTLGSRGECFPALKSLGHTIRPLLPALGPLTCEMSTLQKLQGLRLDAKVTLIGTKGASSSTPVAETTGNLIFTQWGLNGPAVMDLSHWVARSEKSSFELRLNFLPAHETQVRELIESHRREDFLLSVIPCSSLPPKMTDFILMQAGFTDETTLAQISDKRLAELLNWITAFPVKVKGVRDFDTCQVTAGGVPVEEVDPLTMQSRRVPGLYLAGESLDVVGPCGGYNLQFAFSTGAVAGRSMGKN